MTAPNELEALRRSIDSVDQRLLELFAERARLVLAVGDYKRQRGMPVYDPERERNVLQRLSQNPPAPLDSETVRKIFERLIDEWRRIEQHHVQAGPKG